MTKLAKLLLKLGFLVVASPLFAQQTYTGVIKDLSGAVVTSGQVTFTLTPPTESTIPGTGRFVPTMIPCNINSDGTLSGFVGGVVSGACIVTANISLSPTGTSYKICEQPYFATPGSCFFDYALGGTKDISSVAPTLSTGPINFAGPLGPPGPAGPQGPQGSPTSGVNLTPSVTQTVIPSAGAATNIGTLQMTNNFSFQGGVTYRAWGDSMTIGFGVPAGDAYPNLISTFNAWPGFGNGAVSGDMCPDAAQHIIGQYTVAPGQVNSLMIGFNDNYFFGSVDYRLDYYRHCQESLIAWMGTLPTQKVLGSSGSGVTYGSGWTSTGQYGGILFSTTTVGSAATISLPPATAIDVVTVHQNGDASTYSISVDGVLQVNSRSNTTSFSAAIDFTSNNGNGFAPYDHHFSGLPNVPHTVVITPLTIVSGFPVYFAWAQATSPGQNGTNAPSVYVGTIPRSTAAAYSGSPAGIGPANVSAFNDAQYLNIQELGAAGVNVSLVDVSNTFCFDPNVSANVQADGIHPTALGDTFIAACYEKAMANTVTSRNNMPYWGEGRWYKSGFYLGQMPFDASGATLVRGQFNSATFASTSSTNTGKYGVGADGNGSFERLANDSITGHAVFGLLDSTDGFDSLALGKYAAGFPLLWFDSSVGSAQTWNFGVFGKGSRQNLHVNSLGVDGAETINGQPITGRLLATTGTITGTALTSTCDSGTVTVSGAAVGNPVKVSSTTGVDVGGAFNLRASVTSANTITVYVCGTGTPASLAYNVEVRQ